MKYVNYDLVKNYIEEKQPCVTNGEFGYNRIYDFYYYQRSMVPPSCDCFAYKFYDFDVFSYRLPYFGDLQETNEIDILEYIKYVMEHIEPKLLERYKKDLEQYWANQKHNVSPRSRRRAEKIKSLFEKENSQSVESREDVLGVNMILPKLVLRRMSLQLKSRSDTDLEDLLKHYEFRLANLDDEDYKRYSKSINQRIKVVKSEIYRREMLITANADEDVMEK